MAPRFLLTLCIAAALLARSRAQYRASAWIGGGGSTLSGFAAGGVGGNAASLASKPFGVAWSGGTLFFTDYSNSRIRAVNGSAPVWSVAGGGSATGTASGYANGVGSAALFFTPTAVVPLGGRVFTLDNFPGVRAIALATSTVSVLAGGPTAGNVDGVGTNAKFAAAPYGMCSNGADTLFVADINNHVVRAVVVATAAVSTLAGSTAGYANGVGVAAKFTQPAAVAFAAGVVFVAENGNHAVRTIAVTGAAVAPFVGGGANGITAGIADGVGSNALFRTPQGCATSPDGVLLYVADTGNNRVRVVNIAAKLVSTAGGGGATGTLAGYVNGLGSNALFNYPTGVAVDPATGAVAVGDVNNNIIRTLTPPAPVWSFPADQGTGLGGFTLTNPAGITFGPDRNSCPGGALFLQNSAYMATNAVIPELPTGNAPRSGSVWIVCSGASASVYEWGGGGGAANARSGTLASAWGIVGESNDCFITGSACNGAWNHLAFTYTNTGNTMILYRNGAAVKTCASSASVVAARARRGALLLRPPALCPPTTHARSRARSAGARRDSLAGVCWLQRQPRAHWRRAVRPQRHRRLH